MIPSPNAGITYGPMRTASAICVGVAGLSGGAIAPPLNPATPTQIAEAVRVGPYVMPAFGEGIVDTHELNSIIRYIEYARHPDNHGGWSLSSLGPMPEGLVALFIGTLALVALARLLGRRTEQ
jgi:ubiquinol-cytochrome c reductase cytochrome c subunit